MRIKKAYLTSLALIPATILPLSTATSCSQTWGFKTPLSVGSTTMGGLLDPYKNFRGADDIVDLNGDSIVSYLQSNYAIDTKSNGYYGFSLPEKWNAEASPAVEEKITWEKGNFENGSAAWYNYSSSDFTKAATRTGTRNADSKKVSETVYSYRNNTLDSNIQLVSLIASSISSYLNYALQYQGTQIGTEYASPTETDTNLATSWGGNLTHGEKTDETNRKFFESIYAANAVSGTAKAAAALHPTHVEFGFNIFPIVAYAKDESGITGVHSRTLTLLNGANKRPKEVSGSTHYWSSVQTDAKETVYDIREAKEITNTYNLYTFTNVPVAVSLKSLTRAYVNPTKNDSFIVSDFYPTAETVKNTIGSSWSNSLSKFASGSELPTYSRFSFIPLDGSDQKDIFPLSTAETTYDVRLQNIYASEFIVLLNYAYKEYTNYAGSTDPLVCAKHDRVTMTGLTSIFPAFFIDKDLKLGNESTFFKKANEQDTNSGYIIDSDKINKYSNLFFELMKRSSGQGLVTEANKLNDTSKQLLKLLAYMFGDKDLKVNIANNIETSNL